MLLSDLYFLDHYGRSAHFPGHAVVFAGYDDEVAYLSDTAFAELQTSAREASPRPATANTPCIRSPGTCSACPRRSTAPR